MNYYIHVPFCRSKCGYCAFYSEAAPVPGAVDAYLDRLEFQFERLEPAEPCETVYFGGGTPTLLSEMQLERLFSMTARALRPDSETEISIEANPETLTVPKIALLRSFASRISLGVQSFDARFRATLGRDCEQAALERAIERVAAARFPHWSCDLIYAIPGQEPADFERDLARAVALGIDHLSCYSLTPEEGARLADSLIPDEDDAARMWELAGRCGLPRYEISNYAAPGCECRHNRNVWRGGLLTGLGPAAAGFDGTDRKSEPASLAGWLRGDPPEIDAIAPAERLNEIFAVNLRTASGWTPELWAKVPNADAWDARVAAARRAAAETLPEWFDISPERITLSDSGLLFWNTVAETIL
ncbi:coproporphyrinogen III oxidase [Victivallales bacterium CCUG 44730]|nr:coproporphyrinogen III oxidase [Victivallales bacterium CCUG 44730]HBP08311.1 coproporphyrinogen III oxidase family protein [Lentisphaeria bacterium]